MPKISDEVLERTCVRLYKSDLDTLRDIADNSAMSLNHLIREAIRNFVYEITQECDEDEGERK